MADWKIVRVTMLVHEDEADELHSTYGRFTEHDELSVAAYIETYDLGTDDVAIFGPVIEDQDEDS
jgi:hypothetical protein